MNFNPVPVTFGMGSMTPRLKFSDFRSPIFAPEDLKRANSQIGYQNLSNIEIASLHSLEDIDYNKMQLPIIDFQDFNLHEN